MGDGPKPPHRILIGIALLPALVVLVGIGVALHGRVTSTSPPDTAVHPVPVLPSATPVPRVRVLRSTLPDTDLVYRPDQSTPGVLRLYGADWTGHQRGEIDVTPGAQPFLPSPDGRHILVGDTIVTPTGGIEGRLVENVLDQPQAALWSGTPYTLCAIVDAGTGPTAGLKLIEIGLGEPSRSVASLAGSPTWELLACDDKADRAVVANVDQHQVMQIVVYRLSTGDALSNQAGPECADPTCASPLTFSSVVANHDGSLVAENPASGGDILIRNTSDWSVVGRLQAATTPELTRSIIAFSWDSTRVVAGDYSRAGAGSSAIVLDWRSQRSYWSETGYGLFSVDPHPGDAAVVVIEPAGLGDAWELVDAAGSARRIV